MVGGEKALFCEIKDDDEVTLLPFDDDYVSSERACESEDRPPFICDTERGDIEFSDTERNNIYRTAISEYAQIKGMSLSSLRRMCDLCMEPLDDEYTGGTVTCRNVKNLFNLRFLAELALKFFNDTKSKNFKLVKVCKINFVARTYCGLTFRAQEDGSEECPLFRGVVYGLGGAKAMFCEIKDIDDEVTLMPFDDDYVSSEPSCESEDRPL